jgi:hypothetical protein
LRALQNEAQVLLAAAVLCIAGVSQAAVNTPASKQRIIASDADCAQVHQANDNADKSLDSVDFVSFGNGGFNWVEPYRETIMVDDGEDWTFAFTVDPEFADIRGAIATLLAAVNPFRRAVDSGLLLETLDRGQWHTCALKGDKHHSGACDDLSNADSVAGVKGLHGTSQTAPTLTAPELGISRWAWPSW